MDYISTIKGMQLQLKCGLRYNNNILPSWNVIKHWYQARNGIHWINCVSLLLNLSVETL